MDCLVYIKHRNGRPEFWPGRMLGYRGPGHMYVDLSGNFCTVRRWRVVLQKEIDDAGEQGRVSHQGYSGDQPN